MDKADVELAIEKSAEAILELKSKEGLIFLEKSGHLLAETFKNGNKVLLAGNGGSLCEAVHFAEELTGQFRKPRPSLPAIALSDGGYLTCIANDYGFEKIFSRGVEAFGKPGDLFIGFSTSGNSENIFLAFQTAKKQKLETIAFLGRGGGKVKGLAHLEFVIEKSQTSDRIQEAHMTAMHIIIEIMESLLFPEKSSISSSFSSYASSSI